MQGIFTPETVEPHTVTPLGIVVLIVAFGIAVALAVFVWRRITARSQ